MSPSLMFSLFDFSSEAMKLYLLHYLEGALTPEENEHVEQQLCHDAAWRQELARIKQGQAILQQSLRQAGNQTGVCQSDYWSRIQAQLARDGNHPDCCLLPVTLSSYLDGESTEAERHWVESRLLADQPASRMLAAWRQIGDLLYQQSQTVPMPDLTRSVLARHQQDVAVHGQPRQSRPRRGPTSPPWLWLVAGILITLFYLGKLPALTGLITSNQAGNQVVFSPAGFASHHAARIDVLLLSNRSPSSEEYLFGRLRETVSDDIMTDKWVLLNGAK